jgi:predicted Zn-dependent protease
VADATEILWLEVGRGEAANGRRREVPPPALRRSVRVRVTEGGRQGFLATEDGDASQLADAVRLALAHSRGSAAIPTTVSAPSPPPREAPADLFDPAVAGLSAKSALDRLGAICAKGERGHLAWAVHRRVFVASGGPPRRAAATALSLSVRAGRWPGAGVAEGAGRSFAGLEAERIAERARGRALEVDAKEEPPPGVPLVLAPEVVAALLGLLAGTLAARAFEAGVLLSREDLGRDLFAARLSVRDDGSASRGLPFPFDDAGAALAPVAHVEGGRLLTPAVDAPLARALGLPPTNQAAGFDDAAPLHLVLEAGGEPHPDLPVALGEGLWIGAVERLALTGAGRGRFRALAKATRVIADGLPGLPAPLLLWEDDLLRVFREVLEVGSETAAVALDRDLSAAAVAPALAIAPGGLLSPVADPPHAG